MNIEWIKEIANINSIMPIMREAYRIDVDGNQWVFATNREVLYALEQHSLLPPLPSRFSASITRWLKTKPSTLVATVADLRAWAGDDTYQHCYACDENEDECIHCENTGYVNGHEYRNGRINGVLINRWLIAKAFHHVPEGDVHVVATGPNNMVTFIGHGWRVMLMPLTHEVGNIATAEFTAWKGADKCS